MKPVLNTMKFTTIGLTLLTMGMLGCKKDENPAAPSTVVDVINSNGYSRLSSLVGSANLVSTFTGEGPFTVFAPNNAAIDSITPPSGSPLINLLTYHVIAGQALSAADVIAASNGNLIAVTMANGDSVFVRGSSAGVFVNGIQVTRPDLNADNGVVHGIEKVLLPPSGNIVETVINTPGFDSLVKAVLQVSGTSGAGNIRDILGNTNGLTLFAPNNQAFVTLFADASFQYRHIAAIPNDILRNLLLHHAVTSRRFSNDLTNGPIAMANGSNVTVAGVGTTNVTLLGTGSVFTNDRARFSRTNIMARNGVIHAIDMVLMP